MRLILSRKGFDSASGGCPSPLFPDGSLLSLPIPDARSPIKYRDVCLPCALGEKTGINTLDRLVSTLTLRSCMNTAGVHLDPDLCSESLPRKDGWKPLLGQTGVAQGHLRRQQVQAGDLFLFFGLFRVVIKQQNVWRFDPAATPVHALWGWLQIGEIHTVDNLSSSTLSWARYHPHFYRPMETNNTLYVAANQLMLEGKPINLPGAGIFSNLHPLRQLTAPTAKRPGRWRLPSCFYPAKGRTPLSYHYKRERWHPAGKYCYLDAVARGQEFVLDTRQYPDIKGWLADILGAE